MSVKELVIQNYLENESDSAELMKAYDEWKRALTCDRVPNLGVQYELDMAATSLAAAHEVDGLREGFSLACRMFGELLTEMLKGGARA